MAYHMNGLKKPMNTIVGPEFPDIRQGPPRFRDAGKFWQVDSGRTLMDTETNGGHQFREHAVLVQSRSYNQTVYGTSSHKDVVNKAFRPPLRTDEDQYIPLSRRPRRVVVPRTNPGTADVEGNGYQVQNERPNDIDAHLTDRVGTGVFHPTFFAPLDMPEDNSVLPDLETTIPLVPQEAGYEIPFKYTPQPPEHHLEYQRMAPQLQTEYNPELKVTPLDPRSDLELDRTMPHHTAQAGMNTPLQARMQTSLESLDLERQLPERSADAGMNTPLQARMQTSLENLDLERQLPEHSAQAGMNTPLQMDSYDPRNQLELQTQLDAQFHTNPGADLDGVDYTHQGTDQFLQTPIQVGADSGQQYQYRTGGQHLMARPHVRTKVQSRGAISAGGYIPRFGIDQPQVRLKEVGRTQETSGRYRF